MEGSDGSGSRTSINMKSQAETRITSKWCEEWVAFCEFLGNRWPARSLPECSGDDVVGFLSYLRFNTVKIHRLTCPFCGDPSPLAPCNCMCYHFSGSTEALVVRLSAAFEENGGNPEDNPFGSTAVRRYLKEATEMPNREREYKEEQRVDLQLSSVHSQGIPEANVFVSFYNLGGTSDNQEDEDEIRFSSYVLKKLHQRRVFPYAYSLIWTDMGNLEMLHGTRVAVVIFSQNYACHARCLDELVTMTECRKEKDLVIIPVYFNVRPSDVRDQQGRFGEAFSRLAGSVQADQVQKWRTAMIEAASLSGYEWIKGTQFILVEEIVRNVCLRLRLCSENCKNLIGVDFQVKRILSLLCRLQPLDVHIIGIWGMAGVGKTTIAREIFNRLASQCDACYFLQDFHLMCERKGLSHLRGDFLSKIFGEEEFTVSASDIKPSFMRERFQSKMVLVVIDDVSNARDVEILVGGFGWFSPGHRVILTSGNRQVLVQCKVKELYEVQKLDKRESLSLFLRYADKQVLKGKNLISGLVNYASGIPLVLIVLGSSVHGKQINNWEEHLRRLWQHPPTAIQDAFRRSYDRLDENEKNIFLDVACFFRGENKDHVIEILDGCGFFTDLGIFGLIDESLISLLDDRIETLNVFQEMGRFVVCEEDKEPSKRSRLWDPNDIADVLAKNSGTEAIEGIFLDSSNLTFELSPTVFDRMYRLRLLKFYCSTSEKQSKLCLPQGLDSLPNELRLLQWESYPLKSLPRNFNPENLLELNMPYSNMKKLWKGTKNLEKLKKIKLSHSQQLIEIPRLSKAWNLEHIDLEGCTSLVKLSSSIRYLDKLVFLNLKDCSQLRSLPAMVDLESLEVLNLCGCSELEDIRDFSRNLKELNLAATAIREVPSSIENLAKLVTLDLENCKMLQHLPMGISNLKSLVMLKLSGCSKLESLPKVEALYLKGSQGLDLTKTAMKQSVPLVLRHSAIQESRLEDSENLLKSLSSQFRSELHSMCLNNIAIEKLSSSFEYPSTQGICQPYWIWAIFMLSSLEILPLSILHSLGLKLYSVVSLSLRNAHLQDISEEICCLPSLKTLDLGGNGFSRIPKSIKQLSKLQILRLSCCRNLRSLPELPGSLEVFDGHGCTSLKLIPRCLDKIPRRYIFSNCFNLSPCVVEEFFAKALLSVGHMAREHPQELIKAPALSICVPASASQKSTTYLRARSCAAIHLTPSRRKTLLGFALSLVVAFLGDFHNATGFGIRCVCKWKTRKGLSYMLERIFHCWAPREGGPKVRKEHMFVFWDVIMHPGADKGNDTDKSADMVAFEFHPVNEQNKLLHNCTVKKCGVYAINTPTGDTSVNPKRPASSMDPRDLSDDKDMEAPNKRARIRRIIESVILEIRKRKREQIFSRFRNLEKNPYN